jgi:hypothetical protein
MRRHPQVEHPEVALKICGLHTTCAQGSFQIVTMVQPLATGRDLDSFKEQIKAVGRPIAATWSSVKGTTSERETQNKNSGEFQSSRLRAGTTAVRPRGPDPPSGPCG